MNKIVIVLLAIVTLTSCTPKVGVVNTEKLITDYKETVKVEKEIKEKQEKAKQEIEVLIQEFQAKIVTYQKEAKKMSQKSRAQKEQALAVEQQNIQQKQQQLPYQIQQEGADAIQKISKKVNEFVKDYGKKNGYQIIFGTVNVNGAVMYNEDKVDLTDILLKSLNDAYSKDNSSEETKEEKKEETKTEDVK